MCYYATTDFACGDWKWGNMKERCPRQHRMGETCGAKLIHHESITKSRDDCKICQEIQVKQRRLRKEQDNIARWSKEGNKFTASIEKAQREGAVLDGQIRDLWAKRPSIVVKMNAQVRGIDMGLAPTNTRPSQAPYAAQSANGYNSTSHGSNDRHSVPLAGNGAGNTGSNRHAPTYATNIAPSASTNRHSVQYVNGCSSRR